MSAYRIIPQPKQLEERSGFFQIQADTMIVASPTAVELAQILQGYLGLPLTISTEARTSPNQIILSLKTEDSALKNPEAYRLEVSSSQIQAEASSLQGLFYALQTLRQIITENHAVPALSVFDEPRFSWRGLHLDTGRHFFSVDFIKKQLDMMAFYKFNTFHWHLTEDQGWRIEIKRYPHLTEVGSKRRATPLPENRYVVDNIPYEGFYTQAQIKEIIAYAHARFIKVMPEIEMPGHALAALASYPELGCTGENYEVWTEWGICKEVFCAGNPQTYEFLENVLEEVIALFPYEYFHVGGDECPKDRWQTCPKCQAKIQAEGLGDEHGLQSYVIRFAETILNRHGKNLVGWDEILEGGLAPNATVMSWRGTEGGIEAATKGHDVIMTPIQHCYFDYRQALDPSTEPPAIPNFLPLEQVYAFNPVAGVPSDKTQHVLGGQGNLWSEYIPTESHAEYMLYPRAIAMAETLWSPLEQRDYAAFKEALEGHLSRLQALSYNYRRLD